MSTSTAAPVGIMVPLRCTALVITFPLMLLVLCESPSAPLSTAYGGREEVSREGAHLCELVTGIACTFRLQRKTLWGKYRGDPLLSPPVRGDVGLGCPTAYAVWTGHVEPV